MTRDIITVGEIARLLGDRIDQLVGELLPAGVREGPYYYVGSIAGEPGRSMVVELSGKRQGKWTDYAVGRGVPEGAGDALDLVAQCAYRGDKGKAVAWSKQWLGLSDATPEEIQTRKAEAEARKKEQQRQAAAEAKRKSASAVTIYHAAKPIAGTPAELYLKGRGIDFSGLVRYPGALRFHHELWNGESKRHWPALVAAITDIDGNTIAVHRTWLEIHGDGRVTKAPLKEPKMSLGGFKGGAIHLWRGASNKPFRDAIAGETAMVAEGIEDGGTGVMGRPDLRCIVAVSLSFLEFLIIPPGIRSLIVLGQNDTKPEAIAAVNRAMLKHLKDGVAIRFARSPVGKDLNDLLTSKTEEPA
jgi:hypothetical protein